MLPQEPDIERALLGAFAIHGTQAYYTAELTEDDFYMPEYRAVYRAMSTLVSQGKEPSLPLLTSHLRDNGGLEYAGGAVGVASLGDPDLAAYMHQVKSLAAKLKEVEFARRAHLVLREGLAKLKDGADANETAIEVIGGLSQQHREKGIKSVGEVLTAMMPYIMTGKQFPTYPFGVDALDRRVGGMRQGRQHIVAARPSMGKSAIALKTALENAALGKSVLYAALEMTEEDFLNRALANMTGISLAKLDLNILNVDERKAVRRAQVDLDPIERNIKFLISPGITPEHLAQKVRIERARGGCDLLIVDHIGLMNVKGVKRGDEYQTVSEASKELKNLATAEKIPVLIVVQLSREVEKRSNRRPLMSDLRGSGHLEQNADGILLLYRDQYYNPVPDGPDNIEINVAKWRQGVSTGTVLVPYSLINSFKVRRENVTLSTALDKSTPVE